MVVFGEVEGFGGCWGWVEDYGDLLAIGRAEAKRLHRTHENVNVKDILYSAKCGVHIIVFEVPERVVANPPKNERRVRVWV